MQDRKTWLTQLGHGQTIDVDEAIHWLGDTIPWLYRYSQTEQDPIWHGEGNVHIHTDMVLEQLYVLFEKEASYLDETQRQALVLGALLHDIAKTKTTKRKEIQGIERVVAPKHEDNGRSYLAYRLMDLELPISQVHRVMGLVGEHHMPKLLVVKNAERGAYWRLSRKADTELLYWLEVADMRGRICPDLQTQLSYLDEFRLFCEEYDVWGKTYEFALKEALLPLLENCSSKEKKYTYAHAIHAFERDEIFVIEEAIAKAYANRVAHPELVILCGPSGSGKSSWISENVQKYQLISLDEIRREINGNRADQSNFGKIVNTGKERLRQGLRQKRSVVWDATNLRIDFRNPIIQLGYDYHALVSLVVFQPSISKCFERNQKRRFALPNQVLSRQIETAQWPQPDEAHCYEIIDEHGQCRHNTGDPIQLISS